MYKISHKDETLNPGVWLPYSNIGYKTEEEAQKVVDEAKEFDLKRDLHGRDYKIEKA